MNIKITFEPEFDALYKEVLSEYPELLEIDGISPYKVDVGQMSHDYFTSRLADISVDENANANEEKSANNYQAEVTKGILKIEGYYLLWRYAKKRFNVDYANKLIKSIWSGDLYFHDASGHGIQIPYCFAFSTTNIMLEGRPYGQLHSLPPKRADSFIAQVIETTMDLSQEFAGAIAPSDMLVNYSYFAKKEGLTDKQILNDLQKFVHVMNNKFRVSGQSPFVNISLFDRPNLEKVFEYTVFPDGSKPDFDSITHIQKLFGTWFSKGDPVTKLPYRFPIVTINLHVNEQREIQDKDFLEWASQVNIEKGSFNIYINEGNKIATCCRLSNDFTQARADSFGNGGLNIGCYDDKTEVLTENGWKFFKDLNDEDKICTLNPENKNIEFHKPTSRMSSYYNGEMHHYKHQSLDLLVTPNHNMSVFSRKTGKHNLIQSKDLGTGYNMLRNGATNQRPNKEYITIGSKEYNYDTFMKFLGLYIGDGSVYSDKEEARKRAYEISFCVIKERKIIEIRQTLSDLGVKFNEHKNREGIKFVIYNKDIFEFLHPLKDAKNKYIPRFILKEAGSRNLRKLLEGLLFSDGTDGSNGVWYYTSSKQLKDDVVEMCALLGLMTNTFYRERCTMFPDGREVRGACYEIKILKTPRIKRLSKYRNKTIYKGMIYCVEVPNHILMVRRNDTVAWCGNSHRVVTVNLPRIAIEADGDEVKFFNLLEERLNSAKDLLLIHREEILKRRVKSGFLKFFEPLKWFNLDMLFSTFGIIGVYEACHYMGLPMETEEGQNFAKDVLAHIEKYAQRISQEKSYSFNVEEIPGESTAPALAKKDAIMYGNKIPLYSNQYLPLTADVDPITRIKLTGQFMRYLSGGGILHYNVQDKITDPGIMRKLIELAVKEGVEHFAINYGFGICENGHTSPVGTGKICPLCNGNITDWFTRVIGYFTKISSWNEVRKTVDYPNRKFN